MADSSETKSGPPESWIGRGNNALMRGIGTPGVAIIGVACIGLATAGLLPLSRAAGTWPAANLVGMVSIGLILCLVCAYTYAVIGSAVPRAGADYVLASRVLSGPAAFISSWVFVISSGLAAGSLIGFTTKTVFPAFVRLAQALSDAPFMTDLAKTLVQPPALMLIGTAITLIAFLSMFVTQRTLLRILAGGFVLALIAWGLNLFALGTNSPETFQAAWNHVMGAGSYNLVIPTAKGLGFDATANANLLFPAGLVMGFWIFFGSFSSTHLAGEVKKPERNLLRGNWIALIVVWALLVGGVLLVQRVAPADWLAAESFLSQNPGVSGQAAPWINFYAAILLPSVPLLLLLLLGWLVMLINLAQIYILYTSRIMLAWADDGLLPAGMAYVHPRFRNPLVTMLLAAALVQIGVGANLAGVLFTTQTNFLYFAAITMLIPVTAVTAFPFLKKNWFEGCPALVRLKLGPVPVISIFGVITLAYLVWLMVSPLVMKGGIAPVGVPGIAVFCGETVLGSIWYFGRRAVLRRRGIKIEEAVKVMPRSS